MNAFPLTSHQYARVRVNRRPVPAHLGRRGL